MSKAKNKQPKAKTDEEGIMLFGGLASQMTLFDYFLAHSPLPPPWFKWPYRKRRDGEDSGEYDRDYQFSRLLGWRHVYAERMLAASAMGKRHIVEKFNGPAWAGLRSTVSALDELRVSIPAAEQIGRKGGKA